MLIKRVIRVTLLLGLVFTWGILPATAVPTLSITPSSQIVQPGQNFSLNVDIASVMDLFAWEFDLTFDPLILAAVSINEGPFLPTGGTTIFLPGTIDNATGAITFTSDTLVGAIPGVNGNGTIATVDFQALTTLGTSPITLSNALLLDSSLADITASTVDGSVTVQAATAVPEPSTWLLLTTGLVGLLGYGWRRRPRAV